MSPFIIKLRCSANQEKFCSIIGPIGSIPCPCQARLYCARMIWLLTHPLSPSPISKLNQRYTGRLKERQLAEREGGRAEKSEIWLVIIMKTWSIIKNVKSSVSPSKNSGMLKNVRTSLMRAGRLQKRENLKAPYILFLSWAPITKLSFEPK